ncbi:MAG: divalent-cation tolerance protein CutA [Pirellulales bacterium]|nr:divalent-cation tolerance protein CutA [Pirellulales bacterium]
MTGYIQVVTTAPTRDDAETIARALVNERLAACVQMIGPILSTYHWEGKVETSQEWQCLIKTRRDLFDKIVGTIRALHPYKVPEILALPITTADRPYLEWIDAETTRP